MHPIIQQALKNWEIMNDELFKKYDPSRQEMEEIDEIKSEAREYNKKLKRRDND